MEIRWIESQFFEPNKIANQMIIVHHTGSKNGQISSLDGIIKWFQPDPWRETSKVSSQYVIPREEQYIVQMVRDEDTAYHAGPSSWKIQGTVCYDLNNRSIGIELQGDGNLMEYTSFQYEALIWLVRIKMAKFGIPPELVQGHQHISPGRKVDPGKLFDWAYFRKEITPKDYVGIPDLEPYEPPPDYEGPQLDPYEEDNTLKTPSKQEQPLLARIIELILSLFRKR